jgi:potassium intermediate/small conductance calcium-activated channel subfamily N
MMCFLGILGIVLMVIENEINFTRVQDKDTKASWFIKLIITITTGILLVLILYYHHIDMSLYYLRNSLEGWRVELRTTKILQMTIEILICAIHPVPRSYPQTDPEKINSDASESNPYSLSYTAIDVGLGLPSKYYLFFP